MLYRARHRFVARARATHVRLLVGAGIAAIVLTACTVATPASRVQTGVSPAWPEQTDAAQVPVPSDQHRGVVGVVQKVLPAVVNVVSDTSQGKGEGTGFVVRSDGIVVTNYHVVEGSQSLTVLSSDEKPKEYSAHVIGGNQAADVAVLKIDATNLPTVELGDSDALQLGQQVVAIGYALGLEGGPTVTTGIVSSLDRVVNVPDENCSPQVCDNGQRTYTHVVQTDAAINPGNSGGPLVNLAGQVIGIDTAGAGAASADNIGFAIQINAIKQTILDAATHPDSAVSYLGVSTIDANDPQLALQAHVPTDKGAFVAGLAPGGPAQKGGIKVGDVIVSFDGQDVTGSDQMGDLIHADSPGDRVQVGLVRQSGSRDTVTVTLGTNPLP